MTELDGRLILVRHARTHDNLTDRFAGWTDSVIAEEGLIAAEKLAAHIRDTYRIDHLYASPLQRAWVTADLIGLATGLEPKTEDGLKEIHFGDVEGLTRDEFRDRHPSAYEVWSRTHDLTYHWPNGELRADFHQRVRATLDRMIGRHPGETVLAVSHGGCIAGYVAALCDGNLNLWRTRNPDNCSVTEIVFRDGGAELICFNETGFLAADHFLGGRRPS